MNLKSMRLALIVLSLGLMVPTFASYSDTATAKTAQTKAKGKAKAAPKGKAKAAPKAKAAKGKAVKGKATVKGKVAPKAKPVAKTPVKAPVAAPVVPVMEPTLADTDFPEETESGPWIEMFALFGLISAGAFFYYRRKKKGGGMDGRDEFQHSKAETAFGSNLSSLDLDKSKNATSSAKPLSQTASKFSKHG